MIDDLGIMEREKWRDALNATLPAISQWTNAVNTPRGDRLLDVLEHVRASDSPDARRALEEFYRIAERPAREVAVGLRGVATVSEYLSRAAQRRFIEFLKRLPTREQVQVLLEFTAVVKSRGAAQSSPVRTEQTILCLASVDFLTQTGTVVSEEAAERIAQRMYPLMGRFSIQHAQLVREFFSWDRDLKPSMLEPVMILAAHDDPRIKLVGSRAKIRPNMTPQSIIDEIQPCLGWVCYRPEIGGAAA